jgi:hypothetical protein
MKKAASIFFLFTFFLFQYGKMLDYMECRIAAAIESKSDCGCDNKLADNTTGDPSPQPFHGHHLKNYTEEFFDHCSTNVSTINCSNHQYTVALLAEEELPGHPAGILQPPRI